MKAAILALLLLPSLALAQGETPLLAYAQKTSFATPPDERGLRSRLAEAIRQIEEHSPPSEGCAQTLGAARFASMYEQLGWRRTSVGEYDGAIEAYEKALDCEPRATRLHALLAAGLMHDGRFAEARQAALRGLEIDRDALALNATLAELDYIEERWADAVARWRRLVNEEPDDDHASYYQCFFLLAQRRAGVPRPELPSRIPSEGWPGELVDAVRGEIGEMELLESIEEEPSEIRRREMLAEALYYMGQLRLANGEKELARRYFAAVVNLKVLYFVEHHMARAELAKMRAAEESSAASLSN